MTERKALSKKTRFEVFKRDSFTCQYCGAKAPDVVLQADHVDPVANGGSDALLNLVTSCAACNGGKGARLLSDSSAIEKQRKQLDVLQERREQIDMMVDWQKGLGNVDDHATERLADFWADLVPGWHLNDKGKAGLRKLLRKYSIDIVMTAMRASTDQYLEIDGDPPKASAESVDKTWDYVSRICAVREAEKTKPYLRDLFLIRGSARRQCGYFRDRDALHMLEEAFLAGVALSDLQRLANTCRSWTGWSETMERWTEEAKTESVE